MGDKYMAMVNLCEKKYAAVPVIKSYGVTL